MVQWAAFVLQVQSNLQSWCQIHLMGEVTGSFSVGRFGLGLSSCAHNGFAGGPASEATEGLAERENIHCRGEGQRVPCSSPQTPPFHFPYRLISTFFPHIFLTFSVVRRESGQGFASIFASPSNVHRRCRASVDASVVLLSLAPLTYGVGCCSLSVTVVRKN